MPKRTNEFQKIVYLVKRHALGDRAIVAESEYLYDKAAKIKREVDVSVCIPGVGGARPTNISVECTKLKERPPCRGWSNNTANIVTSRQTGSNCMPIEASREAQNEKPNFTEVLASRWNPWMRLNIFLTIAPVG